MLNTRQVQVVADTISAPVSITSGSPWTVLASVWYQQARGNITTTAPLLLLLQGTDGWNKELGTNTIVTPEYDSDGKAGFSTEERQEMITIWKGVSEHFSLWDVDVTTEDPGDDGLER